MGNKAKKARKANARAALLTRLDALETAVGEIRSDVAALGGWREILRVHASVFRDVETRLDALEEGGAT